MAKKVKAVLKLQLPAGKATPAPPVGPALGQHGVNIMAFVKEYNERTASQAGTIIPVELTIFEDRSFSFVVKTPPVAELIRKALSVEKGSAQAGHQPAGKLSQEQVRQIAQAKMQDLSAATLEAAMHTVEGTAKSMGIEVE